MYNVYTVICVLKCVKNLFLINLVCLSFIFKITSVIELTGGKTHHPHPSHEAHTPNPHGHTQFTLFPPIPTGDGEYSYRSSYNDLFVLCF